MYSVLYVDDEPNLLAIGKLFLERSGDFVVDTKESAQEGLAVFGSRHFDAIISDYQMPEKDGIQFLKEVRSGYGDVPFILFTGRGREEVVIEAINSGADFYIQKGGDPKSQFAELAHKIKQAVSKKHAEASLRTSERLISDIIGFLPDATFAIDRKGTVIAWNWAIEAMTGVKARDIIGSSNYEYAIPFFGARRQMLADMIVKPDESAQQRLYPGIKKDGNVLIAESEEAKPKGKPAILWTRATPLYDAGGNVIGAIESLRDITEFRRLYRAHQQEMEEQRKAGIAVRYTPGIFDKLVGKSANSWVKRGTNYYYKYGNFEEALQCFDRAIEIDPKNWQAWNSRGICLKELGRYEEALQCFDRVIDSDDEEVFYNKGETLEKMGEANGDYRLFLEAITCFDRVISKNPGHVYALNYKGVCLKELGRSDEAKIYFDHAQLIIRRGENKTKPRPVASHRNAPQISVPDFSRHMTLQPQMSGRATRNAGKGRSAEAPGSGSSPDRDATPDR
ncbi:MAG TPA: tetratricopeptide repeat protein [Methanoregulaceae archaeon]|nr:tetratricopeptide repeat protein [Methanoregulaceae archaeon]